MTAAVPPIVHAQDRTLLDQEQVAARVRLAEDVRALIEAAVLTDAPEAEIGEVADRIRALTGRLDAARLPAAPMGRAPDTGRETRGMDRQLGNAVTGVLNPIAPPLLFEVLPDGAVRSAFTLDEPYEGPPGLVHGGISAAVFDQVLGMAAAAAGTAGFTAALELRYRRPTPLRTPLTVQGEIVRTEGRKSWAEGRLTTPDGTVTVEATALFITPRHLMPTKAELH